MYKMQNAQSMKSKQKMHLPRYIKTSEINKYKKHLYWFEVFQKNWSLAGLMKIKMIRCLLHDIYV